MTLVLTEKQIKPKLHRLAGWKLVHDEITKTFKKKNFIQAMGFVNQVALLAEKANHHPDIDIRWNKVKLTLSTHSAGGVTENDIELAKAIEKL